jgi:hypothetical protein
MRVNCPQGWGTIIRLAESVTMADRTVEILEGICNSCDLCGIETCDYYDTSREATRAFCQALNRGYTWEGVYERELPLEEQRRIHLTPRPKRGPQIPQKAQVKH